MLCAIGTTGARRTLRPRSIMRIVGCAALFVACASAHADWVKVAESDGTAYYFDAASVAVQAEGLRRASVIQDYAAAHAGGIRSRRVTYEIDCSGERLRSVDATAHAEPMGQGRVVGAWQATSEWLYVTQRTGSSIARSTPYRLVVKAACPR